MDNSKHLNKPMALSPLACLGLTDNIFDLLLHQFFLITKRYIYTCMLKICHPVLQPFYIQTVMTSMEIEKEIASNNNNISSFQNKRSPINFAPRTNKLADIK